MTSMMPWSCEELGEAVDQVVARRRRRGAPTRPRRRRRRRPGSSPLEHGDLEVEDHEVVVVVDALDPADQRAAHALEAGLLAAARAPPPRPAARRLDPPAGHRPLPRGRAVAPPDQQQAVVVDDDGADARARGPRVSGVTARGSRCTTMARAVEPEASRRSSWWPGCPAAPGRRCRRSPARAPQATIAGPSCASPTPTPRASGST